MTWNWRENLKSWWAHCFLFLCFFCLGGIYYVWLSDLSSNEQCVFAQPPPNDLVPLKTCPCTVDLNATWECFRSSWKSVQHPDSCLWCPTSQKISAALSRCPHTLVSVFQWQRSIIKDGQQKGQPPRFPLQGHALLAFVCLSNPAKLFKAFLFSL